MDGWIVSGMRMPRSACKQSCVCHVGHDMSYMTYPTYEDAKECMQAVYRYIFWVGWGIIILLGIPIPLKKSACKEWMQGVYVRRRHALMYQAWWWRCWRVLVYREYAVLQCISKVLVRCWRVKPCPRVESTFPIRSLLTNLGLFVQKRPRWGCWFYP